MVAAAELEEVFRSLLVCLVIVLLMGKLAGQLCRWARQPVVIGEILVGIALGPSLLGQLPGSLDDRLFPDGVLPYLKVISQVGLVLFMFVVGLEVDMEIVRRKGRRAITISLSSIAVPFLLGMLFLGHVLYDDNSLDPLTGERIDFVPFAFFLGVSMCATAFAVLARILAERDMFKIPLGSLLIACAAVDDVMAFTLLAVSVALAEGGGSLDIVMMIAELLIFLAVLFFVVRPIIDRLVIRDFRRSGKLSADHLGILFIGLLASSFCTSLIGVHELIGAFFFGLLVPREGLPGFLHAVADRVEGVSVHLFLPVFFVVAGQGVEIDGLSGSDFYLTLLILGVAMLGKMTGGAVAARLSGVTSRQSLAVGVMMNTRGLAELVILQVARSEGVINDRVYTMLVIMAVVTTVSTGPLLRLVYPDKWLRRDIADAERRLAGKNTRVAALLPQDSADDDAVVEVALAYCRRADAPIVTLIGLTSGELDPDKTAVLMDRLRVLQQRFESGGVPAAITTRHTPDRGSGIVGIVEQEVSEVVVQSDLDAATRERLAASGADVVTTRPGLSVDRFAAGLVAPGAEPASTEIALRMALGLGVGCTITGVRRSQRRVMRNLGLGPASSSAVSVASGEGAVIRVEPGRRDRTALAELLPLGSPGLEPEIVTQR